MSTSSPDRWLLPRRQTEFPAHGLLPEETLHRRREATFLVLATLMLVSAAALVMLGTSRVVDVSALAAHVAPDLALPTALLLPLGVVPVAASFVAASLVCELFGRRRATALVWSGAATVLALAGLMRVADVIDDGQAFGGALAFAAAYIVGHAAHLLVFDRLRRTRGRGVFARTVVAALVGNVLGWSAFAGVLAAAAGTLAAPIAPETVIALAVCSAACVLVLAVVLAIPAALAARGLAVALRVGRELFADPEAGKPDLGDEPVRPSPRPAFAEGSVARRLPPALIVDDDAPGQFSDAPRARVARGSIEPFSSAEMQFFDEGDALAK